ncbi:hypothetical protein FS837_012972 [Tulasnella sp. UAMH 9824]|nr:hypothetical protein FS837_012972 [Tulasnella sp. UAMH 9824]
MELRSVRNDLTLLLNRHNYLHKGTQDKFLIYTDYKHEYTDSRGIRAFVPRKEASKPEILAGLLEVIGSGGNAVIYYAGHAARRGAGKSTILEEERKYIEDGIGFAGPPYLITSDGARIYGEEFYAVIKKTPLGRTITMVFDACHIGTFFEGVIAFPHVYRAHVDVEFKAPSQPEVRGPQAQLIFVAAAHFGEGARTFKQGNDSEEENGAVTVLMDKFFAAPLASRSAQVLVERLFKNCYEQQQRPRIYSLLPIVGDFELLP